MPGITLPPKLPFKRVGIAGLGLIGGSLAKALIPFGGMELYVFDRDPKTVEAARKVRRFAAVTDRAETFLGWPLDLAYLCLPVRRNVELIGMMGAKGVTYPVTDAGSTKNPIVGAAAEAGLNFCGGHPISGREVSGYANSSADLIRGCLYILTPPGDGPAARELTGKLKALHELLDCRVRIMPAPDHDRLYGLVSHLPFLSASALAGTVLRLGGEGALSWAGTGFKDSTRVGASAPAKWVEIAMENAGNLTEDIGALINILGEIRQSLQTGDADGLMSLLEPISAFRQKFPKA
jgi:prephenate dehydrogenase